MVSEEGIEVAPGYDLLSTAVYATPAIAPERTTWTHVALALPPPGAKYFGEMTRQVMMDTGAALGLRRDTVVRELGRLVTRISAAADALYVEIEGENEALPESAKPHLAGELRILRAIQHIVIHEMAGRLKGADQHA